MEEPGFPIDGVPPVAPCSERVVLVQMPWGTTERPSIQLGILAQLCREGGVEARVLYPCLDLTVAIGFEAADLLTNMHSLSGLAEHFFAAQLFGRRPLHSDAFLGFLGEHDILPHPLSRKGFLKQLRDDLVPEFLDAVLARVLDADPTVVGFSCTFNQTMAAFALGKRIKEARPDIQIIAGGASVDGDMGQELHRAIPAAIDHVFVGEAEDSFREFLRRRVSGETTHAIPGVTYRADGALRLEPGRPLLDMNQSPRPDYDDFFREKERVLRKTGKGFVLQHLPFEGARGCWWGDKSHCTFCGLNRELIEFREKDVDRIIRDVVHLSSRYKATRLTATDWIMSRKNRTEFFQKLKELDLDIEIFYELRADFSKAELMLMKDAGVVEVQPGIESLSTPLLKLMGKGTNALRHIQFIRWCTEVGVDVTYNILRGFPGEKVEWYLAMADLMARITHVQPPTQQMFEIEMHRFSPLFERRAEFSIDEVSIRGDYKCNFPTGSVDLMKVGYYYEYQSSIKPDPGEYEPIVSPVIADWMSAHASGAPPRYVYAIGPGFLQLTDTRRGEGRGLCLKGLRQDVVLLCDEVSNRDRLARDLEELYPEEVDDGTLDRVIDELIERDVLLAEGRSLLTLPIGHRPRTTGELREYVLSRHRAGAASLNATEPTAAIPAAMDAMSLPVSSTS